MLATPETAREVASFLRRVREAAHLAAAARIPVVLDPVLVSSSGRELYPANALETLHDDLLPEVDVLTPNFAELAALTGCPISTDAAALAAAETLSTRHPHLALVVTAGDRKHPTDLLRLPDGTLHRFPGEHLASTSTHGTGCAFSSALLANLVLGHSLPAAVAAAKRFVTEAIRRATPIGHGRGPLHLLGPRSEGIKPVNSPPTEAK